MTDIVLQRQGVSISREPADEVLTPFAWTQHPSMSLGGREGRGGGGEASAGAAKPGASADGAEGRHQVEASEAALLGFNNVV